MAKPKKTPRPRAETPKGFRDYFGAQVTRRTEMLGRIAAVYHRYGFDALESSGVETVEALGKFLPDVDRPNEGVFAWQEDAEGERPGDWLALRYDLTAPLARVYAQHQNDLPKPYRRYAMGPVWRNEKPGPGRFRQFYQCDADTVGASSVAADAEICAMLADCLEEVGIERGDYIIRVNNRKVLNGVLEVAGLSGDDKEAERGIVLRAIDKLDRLGPEGVRALLGEGRKDESGDFTEGAGLSILQTEKIMGFVSADSEVSLSLLKAADLLQEKLPNADRELHKARHSNLGGVSSLNSTSRSLWNRAVLSHLRSLVNNSQIGMSGVEELEEISELLLAFGYEADRIVIDPSVVRGLGYYTGPVYEAELTFDIRTRRAARATSGPSRAGGGMTIW